MNEKLVLIDGHSILNRAFYGVPDLTNSEGLHTNAIYGFLNIMFKILEEEKPDYLTVAFDLSAPTFRHKMFDSYKGTRKSMPEELREQVPIMKDVLAAMGISTISKEGYEADDILGTLAKNAEKEGREVSIISGDRDLLQLASKKIKIRIPKTKRTGTEIEDYKEDDVIEKYQVTPTEFIDLKALMGDPSDNIPGLPGVGEKTATKIIVEYKSIENAHVHVEDLKPNRAKEAFKHHFDLAILSKDLATIKTDCVLDYQLEEARLGNLYTEEAYEYFQELEFKNLLNRFDRSDSEKVKIEEYFKKVTMLDEAERIFEALKKQEGFGFSILGEGKEIISLALAFSNEDIYCMIPEGFLTEEYLLSQLERAIETVPHSCTNDLKYSLNFIEVKEQGHVFDAGIAAYLINPLKDQYTYDDIAKEYLDMLIPNQSELLGKKSFKKALEEDEDGLLRVAGYIGYTAYAAMKPLDDKLNELEMKHLFEDIELPLIYTLYDMEREGILV
ncbi:MAG TPA: DNA polymerase I, partial [Candidatus Merdenecus merdavium]|nr:DNA polymerase I [Candidatus Merdenecus merdavium]